MIEYNLESLVKSDSGDVDDLLKLRLDYLRFAYQIAAKHSTDPSTQNGAILVSAPKPEWAHEIDEHNEVVYVHRKGGLREFIFAANMFPKGVKESPERWTRPAKYKYVEHAERNVIYLAAKKGFCTEGATMYVAWFACADCARAIIQAGVSEVVGHDYPLHKEQSSWQESIEVADKMLEEAGVKFTRIPGHFGIKVRFNGQVVEV
jgi:deoxycytidylate deaminase